MDNILEISISFVLTILALFPFIKWMKKMKVGQHIRQEGPDMHNYKEGTPTMAGIIFIPIAVIVALIFDRSSVTYFLAIATMGFWAVGFADGLIQTFFHRSEGLNMRQKLFFQTVIAIVAFLFAERLVPHLYTYLPFTGSNWNLAWFYPIVAVIFTVGMSNASNLTDGLDGLDGGVYLISSIGLLIFSVMKGLPLTLTLTSIGAVLAFLFYNVKPAKIFMGDVGSLALGGYIGAFAMLYGYEIWMIILFPLFIIEALSVIIQVTSFKIFKKRVFRMSPIHHHFELAGYSEFQVTVGFWLFQAVCTAIMVVAMLWILH